MSTTTATSLVPTAKEALQGGKDLGMVALGMIAGHSLITVTKKDNAMINGALAVGGFGVYIKSKNPMLKMLGLGAAAFGTIKLVNNAVKEVATPGTTEGLNGFLPEAAKSYIRKYLPTLSGMDEIAGYEQIAGDDDYKGLSLNDVTMRGEYDGVGNDQPAMEGLGDMLNLAA
jgi:hypothetical protein